MARVTRINPCYFYWSHQPHYPISLTILRNYFKNASDYKNLANERKKLDRILLHFYFNNIIILLQFPIFV